MRNYIVKEESLTAIADSIRAKTGETEELVFPDGFVEAVEGISVGEEIDPIARIIGEGKLNAVSDESDYRFHLSNGSTLSFSAIPTAEHLFSYCHSLTIAPLVDTSKVQKTSYMFYRCYSLTTVPLFDTNKATQMRSMFEQCSSLTTIPLFDTSNVQMMDFMFNYCDSLTTIPLLDIRKVTNMSGMLQGCYSLTECWLRNIKTNLQVGSGTFYGHLLTVESLLHLIKECRDTGSMKTLTIGTANLEKLANTYVRTIDITDEMRAEDDLIDEKLPFEVCESTDEGAMLISEYVLLKNWQLK